MNAHLVAKDLSGGHAHRTLFSDLSFTVAPGDVVGVDGAGKSTLLKLLAGIDAPQSGSVTASPQGTFIGWLPQEHERIPGETIIAYLARCTGCAAATRAMEPTDEALGSGAAKFEKCSPTSPFRHGLKRNSATATTVITGGRPHCVAARRAGSTRSCSTTRLGAHIGVPDFAAVDNNTLVPRRFGQTTGVRVEHLAYRCFRYGQLLKPTPPLDVHGSHQQRGRIQGHA